MTKTLLVLMPTSLGIYILYRGAAQVGDGYALIAGCVLLSSAYIIAAINLSKG